MAPPGSVQRCVMQRINGWRGALDLLATALVIIAALAVTWSVGRRFFGGEPGSRTVIPVPKNSLSLSGAVLKGASSARVAVVEYSDFECPFCARFALDTLPKLTARYVDNGKVLFVFRNFPLESIHPMAESAAEAAECARRQDHFWQLHDSLYAAQGRLSRAAVLESARTEGLDITDFERCIGGEGAALVQSDVVSGKEIGVNGTPTFFIGSLETDGVRVKRVITGAQPLVEFSEAIDEVLKTLR